jgi:hypothetical protein
VGCRVQNKFCGVAITEMCVKWDGTVLGYNMVPSCETISHVGLLAPPGLAAGFGFVCKGLPGIKEVLGGGTGE